MSKSIMSNERECYICGTQQNLHRHHIYPGNGRRQISEREGCWCYLCFSHHNGSSHGVHFDKELDMQLRKECERKWMEKNDATAEDFIRIFGINYI